MALTTKNPFDASVVVERAYSTDASIDAALDGAKKAQAEWRNISLAERMAVCAAFCDVFERDKASMAQLLAQQMGRPIRYGEGEIQGTIGRARAMIDLAEAGLAPIEVSEQEGLVRYIEREPVGLVLTIPAWNYPYLITVNSVIPALLAGNAVVLKPSSQAPLIGEHFTEALLEAGAPVGLVSCLHLDHAGTEALVQDPRVDFVAFTGSTGGGKAMEQAAAGRFIGMGLELGGKDPAYVRADANVSFAVENLADGSFFNSGQSCCGVERIYVHEDVYDEFVDGVVEVAKGYIIGDPLDEKTTLGPLAKKSGQQWVEKQVAEAVAEGAKAHIDASAFDVPSEGFFCIPQVLTDVNHNMDVMMEETFGPVACIMKVIGDDEAIALMNDSPYGLTASVWTQDADAAKRIGRRVDTGTFFQNRADFLDPELAWVGVKDSGRGCTLSKVGFEHLTRPKSFHLRLDGKS
ncbi:MAG: aldehyde dehydrogenase family protein [Deltaproteobacteria bacterium]|nr:aldehyde dehydrogenase family protein [Deltaproteobacteria bacterium]